MQTQIDNAFAALNEKMVERQLAWAAARREAVKAVTVPAGKWYSSRKTDAEIEAAGGKAWRSILLSAAWEQLVKENVQSMIARRDANIIKALNKIGVAEIPEFALVEMSDGVEGIFIVAGHEVSIKTILAGGYNIQCLHQRTLIKVRYGHLQMEIVSK